MELKEINSNKETLKKNLLDLIELQHILKKTQVFFQEVSHTPTPSHPHTLTPAHPHTLTQAEAQSMRPGRERRLRARDAESDKRGVCGVFGEVCVCVCVCVCRSAS